MLLSSVQKHSLRALIVVSMVLVAACGQQATSTPTPQAIPTETPPGPTPPPMPTSIPSPTPTTMPRPAPTESPAILSLSDLSRDETLMLTGFSPITLDPALARGSRSHRYITQLFSGLVRLDTNLRVVPALADRWEIHDGGTRYIFHLRPGSLFHSGRRVTAHDVKYSLERAADPATGSETAQIYLGDIVGFSARQAGRAQEISGLRVLDDGTIEIRFDAPKAYVLAKLTYPVAAVVDMDNVATGPHWFRQPNGTGPFKLRAWEDDQFLVLESNMHYYLRTPNIRYVAYRFLAGVPIRLYENGEIDVAPVGVGSLQRVLDPQEPLRQELHIFPSMAIFYTGFNSAKAPFNDPMVRRAFALALDRDLIVQLVLQDSVQKAAGFLPPGMPGYTPDFSGIPFEPEEARQTLARSSYHGPEGLPPIVYTTSGQGGIGAVTSAMIDMWRNNLGVEVTVRQIESDAYFYRLADELDDLFDYGWIADYPDPENILDVLFHSAATNNTGGYANPQVDELLEQARIQQDVQARLELYRQVERILLEDAAAIPRWYDRDYLLVKPYVKGFAITPQGFSTLADVRLERG